MPHSLKVSDHGHPEHHLHCDMEICSPLNTTTELRIIPYTEEEDRQWRTHLPDSKTLDDRIDAILGELFNRDSDDQSFLSDGWNWDKKMTLSFSKEVPQLILTVDRIKEPIIRHKINKILNRLSIRA